MECTAAIPEKERQPKAPSLVKPQFQPHEGPEPYCFVSYSHANSDHVYSILNDLAEHNFRMWFDDTMEIGDDFRKELHDRIAACDAFLLFVSKESMNSKYCGMEIITAHALGKRIYPVQLDASAEIPAALKLVLENLQHVKAHTGEDKYVQRLIKSLPPDTMRRLIIEDGIVTSCADNGTDVLVPEGITGIGEAAFKECVKLQRVTLPESLRRIEDQAFRGCSQLREITLGEHVEYVGHSAFRDCIGLERATLANPETTLAGRTFENCAKLVEVDLPDATEEIFEAAFNSCGALRHFRFPSHLKIIGDSAFSDCITLDNVELPDGVVKIDARAFADCVSLSSLQLPPRLSKIGRYGFKGCTSLREIEIPVGVDSLNGDAFRECVELEAIRVAPANRFFKAVDGVLFNKNRSVLVAYPSMREASEYEVPDSVTVINHWAFCQADLLHSVAIPDSVEVVGEGAFFSAEKLESVVLPPSLERIDDIAFRDCASLRRVEIPSHVWHIGWGAFLNCPEVEIVCEPGSYASRYCAEHDVPHRSPE
ncbi:leucine-rich repeat protein [Patulibacter minatonensis]|uniref:leucine-rich repeat protein n=1 Tax=Patulibacter minatonensis TaxID=298163 RepID=UPI00047E4593|nr:leucine-rich repeat protein [Patulibacter minatonensis]